MMTSDDDAMRTIIELPDLQVKALARLCQREGISRAEAIRRAVDKMVADDGGNAATEKRRAGFGLWRGRKFDGRSYVDALRVEWDSQARKPSRS